MTYYCLIYYVNDNIIKHYRFTSSITLRYIIETRENAICLNYIYKNIIKRWRKYVNFLHRYKNIHYLLTREIYGRKNLKNI